MGNISVVAICVFMGLPTALTGFLFWLLEKKIEKKEKARERRQAERDRKREEKERIQEQNQILVIKGVRAAIALGEASALALKNGKCNGETEKALEYAQKIKHEQSDFLLSQGVRTIV